MKILRKTLIIAAFLAIPMAAIGGEFVPRTTAKLVCPADMGSLQFTSTTTMQSPREINASTYCVVPSTLEACFSGGAACKREPVNAFLTYAAIFFVGFVGALIPALAIAVWRARK